MRKFFFGLAGFFPLLSYAQSAPPIEVTPPISPIMAPRPPSEPKPTNGGGVVALPGMAEQEFGADRPGLTDPTDLLWVGTIQVETGFELSGSSDDTTSSRQALLPQVLFRVGVFPRLELRVSADGYAQSIVTADGSREVTKGLSDNAISAKIKVLESDALNFTIVPSLSIPSFDENFSSGTFDPAVEFVFGRGLPLDLDIGVNINAELPSGPDGRTLGANGGVALGRGIVGDLGAYIELFGETEVPNVNLDFILNGGLTYVFENRYQIDAEYGASITTPGDFFIGFGFATRITRWTH